MIYFPMELQSDAYDVQSSEMLHMDVHCQDLGLLHLMHSPKIQMLTTMLSGTHHYGLTILIVVRGCCEVAKYLVMERVHQTWIKIFADGLV